MTRQEMLEKAVRLLVDAANPKRIILFGSEARGEATAASDFDLLVIEEDVTARRRETVRLLEVLEPHGIPADIFVTSQAFYDEWSHVPGSLLHEARREGRIIYDAA